MNIFKTTAAGELFQNLGFDFLLYKKYLLFYIYLWKKSSEVSLKTSCLTLNVEMLNLNIDLYIFYIYVCMLCMLYIKCYNIYYIYLIFITEFSVL